MLVLKRNVGTSLTIGESVKLIVLESDEHGARLGFEAPKSIPIIRDDAAVVRRGQNGGHFGAAIDAHVTLLAAIVANVEAPQFDRARALSQLVEHCTICGHSAGQNAGHAAPQKGGE